VFSAKTRQFLNVAASVSTDCMVIADNQFRHPDLLDQNPLHELFAA